MWQRSRTQLTIDDIKIFTTPRKLVRSLQNSTDDNSPGTEKQHVTINASPTSSEVKWYSSVVEVEKRKDKNTSHAEDGSVIDGTESVSSTNDLPEGSAQEVSECEVRTQIQKEIVKETWYGKAAVSFVLGLLFIFLAIVFSALRIDNDNGFCDVVPT